MTRHGVTAAFLLATMIAGTEGFVAPSSPAAASRSMTGGRSPVALGDTTDFTGWDSFASATKIPTGEKTRKFRRTVYTHDDWKQHRSPDRFISYLAAIFNNGVYESLAREVTACTAVAAFCCFWNCLFGEFQDLEGLKHVGVLASTGLPVLGMPLTPFTLASPSLGLLLGTILSVFMSLFRVLYFFYLHTDVNSILQLSVPTLPTNVRSSSIEVRLCLCGTVLFF